MLVVWVLVDLFRGMIYTSLMYISFRIHHTRHVQHECTGNALVTLWYDLNCAIANLLLK